MGALLETSFPQSGHIIKATTLNPLFDVSYSYIIAIYDLELASQRARAQAVVHILFYKRLVLIK
ncbi:MAG: hypothetical protein QMD88_06800 [Coprothermobacterota bacterium]|nr:hypothetical protein [Coprothermobacterota bacterium]